MIKKLLLLNSIICLTLMVDINGESIHLCKALKDNTVIDFAIAVPNDNVYQMFIVIGNNYWELEYKLSGSRRRRDVYDMLGIPSDGNQENSKNNSIDNINQRSGEDMSVPKGELKLKSSFSKQSKWLSGKYQTGFGLRYDDNNQIILTLVDVINGKINWALFPKNIKVLTPKGQKSTFNANFDEFKPNVAFIPISYLKENLILVIEDNIGSKAANYRFYKLNDPNKGWTEDKTASLPPAVQKLSTMTNVLIKGLFGLQLPGSSDAQKNGLIVLTERCTQTPAPTNPCRGSITYHYCITRESTTDPILGGNMECHPAKSKSLIDCSKDWSSEVPPVDSANADDEDLLSNGGQKSTNDKSDDNRQVDGHNGTTDILSSTEKTTNSDSGGKSWIIYAIIAVIICAIIAVLCIVLFCVMRKKGTESEFKDKSNSNSQQNSATSDVKATKVSSSISRALSVRSGIPDKKS
ncbi:uncharacterized protein LOC128960350 [Oppia nitens]|uniref:uncharacterized protein LOC128960350 n=1 Tax=Oppia nitens TaxID=1686743 RepID=UPI0023DC17BC|nr:uncharacterized protein LOC128960350 [Oppia nitens]